MSIYGLLIGSVILGTTEAAEAPYSGWVLLPAEVGLGWQSTDGGATFTPPAEAPQQRRISPLAFRRRFTSNERAAIERAATDDPTGSETARNISAALRSDMRNQEQARFIDLDDADVLAGLGALEALGLIASGRAAAIQSAPVQPGERP